MGLPQGDTMPGKGDGSGASETPGVSIAKLDNCVPTFNNQMQDYREYRKRCEIYKKKMELGNRQGEVVYNLVTLMTGKAWGLVEDMSLEQMSATDAHEKLFKRLDKGFKYDPLTELPDDFEQYFVKLQRRPNQTLQEYMNDYTKAERRLEVTHSVTLPDKVRAWWFLRRSGITREQRQLILTNTGVTGLSIDEAMRSMSFILGQDSKLEATSRWSRPTKPADAYYHDDEAQYDWYGTGDSANFDSPPTFFQDDAEWDDWYDGDQESHIDDVSYAETHEGIYDVEEFDEVLANVCRCEAAIECSSDFTWLLSGCCYDAAADGRESFGKPRATE